MAKKKTTNSDTQAAKQLKQLDNELLKLLEKRLSLAVGLECNPERVQQMLADEQARLEKLVRSAKKATNSELLRPVLREALAAERNASAPVRAAYLGPENTFSHLAAAHRFGATAELVPVGSIAAVFEEVNRGSSAMGVVPLENSTDGRVSDTLECFAKTDVRICGELPLRIHHCLLGSGKRSEIRTVCSKPQALSQCRNWLAQHLPQAEPRPVASTAEAAALAGEDASVGAIASERAAGSLGLAVLARNIEDQSDNITRFAVIGAEPAPPTKGDAGHDKTALMFEAPHEPGALADAMGIFKRQKLNLTWIESFPIPGSRDGANSGGRYLFFVEFVGHQSQLHPRRAIAALAKKATQLAVLGSYPQTEPID